MTYNLPAIRQWVTVTFNDEELQTLCFDSFPVVLQDFTAGQTKSQRVRLLVDFAARHDQLDALLDAIQKARPEQFDRVEAELRSESEQPDFERKPFEPETILTPAAAKIDTSGGAFVGGNVNTGGGRFIGRDEITIIVSTPDQAVTLSSRLQRQAELLQPELDTESFEPKTALIPTGPFLMGRDEPDGRKEERPQHTFTLPDFRIGKYPITNAQYLAFVHEQRIAVAPETRWELAQVGQIPPSGRENHPVVGITWDDAVAYCRWLGDKTGRPYRLPSEAEWEKAARGPATGTDETRAYPWGNCFDPNRCNCAEAGRRDTTAVGSYSPQGDSPYGCADMAGNVWEWTSTRWGAERSQPRYTYPHNPGDGRENADQDKPFREYRIVRGGSYGEGEGRVTCTARERDAADKSHQRRGFRVAMGISDGGRKPT